MSFLGYILLELDHLFKLLVGRERFL